MKSSQRNFEVETREKGPVSIAKDSISSLPNLKGLVARGYSPRIECQLAHQPGATFVRAARRGLPRFYRVTRLGTTN